MKANISKDSLIDKLNIQISENQKDFLSNSTSDSDITNESNTNAYTLSITKNKDVFHDCVNDKSNENENSIIGNDISLDSTIANSLVRQVSNQSASNNNNNSYNNLSNSNTKHK